MTIKTKRFDNVVKAALERHGFQSLGPTDLPISVKYCKGEWSISETAHGHGSVTECWVRFNKTTNLLEFIEGDALNISFRSMVPGPMLNGGVGTMASSAWYKIDDVEQMIEILKNYQNTIETLLDINHDKKL